MSAAAGRGDGRGDGRGEGPCILLVSPFLPPHIGGVERYVGNVAHELRRHGCRVLLAAPRPDGRGAAETARLFGADGVPVHWLPVSGRLSNTPLGIGWARRLGRIVRVEGVDLVNAHAPVPFLADMAERGRGRVPFVLTYHTGPMRKGRQPVDALLAGYERTVLATTVRRSAAVICASEYVRETLRPAGRRFEVISPAVDVELFSPGGAVVPDRVLFVGSLEPATRYKGLDDLLEAVRLLARDRPAVHLEVVGEGAERPAYERLAERLGIGDRVRFRGALDGAPLAEAYRRSTVVAVPSRFDNLPTVALEALACGRPVVATAVGHLPALLADGRGQIVAPGEPRGLATALGGVLERPGAGGGPGREHVVDRFSVHAQGRRTMALFERVLAWRRGTVAVLAPHYPPHIGGVERYAERVALDTAAAGFRVVVVSSARGPRTVRERRDGIQVVRLGSWFRWSNTPLNPCWVWQLPRELARHGVDVVNAHSPVPFMADIAAFTSGRRPVVLTYHSGSLRKGGRPVDVLLAGYERWALPRVFARAAVLVAVSPAALTSASGRAVEIPPGVDLSEFVPPVAEPAGPGTVLFVGRLERSSRWKGVPVLIEALARLHRERPGVRLRLVGGGDAVPELLAQVRRLGVGPAVDWSGELRGPALVAAYQSAHVVVLPSLSGAEAFGMALVEAMACARPVIGSRIGGIPAVIRDGVDGLLVPPGDPAALAAACLRVLGDPELARAMGAAGRSAAQRHAWPARTGRYVALFGDLVDRSRR